MPEIPYFGKYLCTCGVRSSTDTHFEIHNTRHLSEDITKICTILMAECKQENKELKLKTAKLMDELIEIGKSLVKFCDLPPKDISPILIEK